MFTVHYEEQVYDAVMTWVLIHVQFIYIFLFSVQYEEQVYDAVMTWVLIDSCKRREHLHSLFKVSTCNSLKLFMAKSHKLHLF